MKYRENRERPEKFERNAPSMAVAEVTPKLKKRRVALEGVIDKIVQTGGPTVFYLSDGTGTLALKAFEGAGERAYPEVNVGNAIKVEVTIGEFEGDLEGEIEKLSMLSQEQQNILLKSIEAIQRKRAEISPPKFLISDKILDKLKDSFIQAATEIRLAIFQNRPIIVRHHNDADGYSSGFSLERAILPLIEKQHGGGKSAWEFYTRAPCAAPFYEIDDSIRDASHSLSNMAKFSNKMPLVVIADNGSSQEDLLGIKQGKVHGMDFIVVDHHFFEEDVISQEVKVHINPFLVGEDGSRFSAGMLCTELARFINPDVDNVEQIAGMAGLADRIDNEDAINAYLEIAKKQGYSKELLHDIATVIDFVSSKVRFMEAREYIEVVFGEPRDRQKDLVSLLAPHIRSLESKGLEIAKASAVKENIGNKILQTLEVEQVFPRGFYPKPGKCVGILHDSAKKEGLGLVSVGILPDAVTIRATDEANFSVHDFIKHLEDNLPSSFAEGGGHKNAGAIKFLPNKKTQVVEELRKFIKSR